MRPQNIALHIPERPQRLLLRRLGGKLRSCLLGALGAEEVARFLQLGGRLGGSAVLRLGCGGVFVVGVLGGGVGLAW